MNSIDIQKSLYWHLFKKSHTLICPNKHLDKWFECDMLSVTGSDYLHEYEIKISKADFKADFKKIEKHKVLESSIKKEPLTEKKLMRLKCPSYFWYVTPIDLLTEEDIPEYSGWMEVSERTGVIIKRDAKRLNSNKIDDSCKMRILESIYHRFWHLKLKQGV